ncbi:MFS transporter [Kineosporia sp. R_H_3]|uniref:MFS transporter n=1 Tax=Kineosporia sp. R_H_3 TaxID=1961848 RepID=UPI0018E91732|nr:MFS transporter [Kineosporia sp. R_H_3]
MTADGGPVAVAVAHNPRTIPVLAGAQVIGGLGVTAGVTVNGVLASNLSGSVSLAGLAQTMGVIGGAALAVPLAKLAGRRGRRPALALGYAIGAVGALLSVTAGAVESFPLLLVGAALFGGGSASGLQARFAAIDGVVAQRRGRALSLVVWAGAVGGVVGPLLIVPAGAVSRGLGVPELVGPFVFAVAGYSAAAVALWALLRPDPLAHVLRAGAEARAVARPADRSRGSSPTWLALRAAVRSRDALLGLTAVGVGHAVMVALMVMTSVHLSGGGVSMPVVGVVISAHVAGMYALSPVWGWLTDRYGRRTAISLGVACLALAGAVAAGAPATSAGRSVVALALLGLGWSGCFVAGSTLLSESVPADVRTSVQGMSDLVMGVVAASAGVLAGPVVEWFGYGVLSLSTLVLLVPVLVLLARRGNRFEPVGGAA